MCYNHELELSLGGNNGYESPESQCAFSAWIHSGQKHLSKEYLLEVRIMNERRRYIRVAIEVNVEISLQINKKNLGRVIDISEAGIFVETGNHVENGDIVVIRFTGQQVMFGATVRRVAENGFGAEFGYMTNTHREVIASFIPKPKQAKVSVIIQRPTVMLLFDNESFSILERELNDAGFDVLKVTSIDKVISSMQRFAVAAVVSEYMLSGRDTLSILKEIKEQEQHRKFPVIMYSGRYDVPCNKYEKIGIQCSFKRNISPRNLALQIKKNTCEDNNK
jgi:CheY-like chemotaxis protein